MIALFPSSPTSCLWPAADVVKKRNAGSPSGAGCADNKKKGGGLSGGLAAEPRLEGRGPPADALGAAGCVEWAPRA